MTTTSYFGDSLLAIHLNGTAQGGAVSNRPIFPFANRFRTTSNSSPQGKPRQPKTLVVTCLQLSPKVIVANDDNLVLRRLTFSNTSKWHSPRRGGFQPPNFSIRKPFPNDLKLKPAGKTETTKDISCDVPTTQPKGDRGQWRQPRTSAVGNRRSLAFGDSLLAIHPNGAAQGGAVSNRPNFWGRSKFLPPEKALKRLFRPN